MCSAYGKKQASLCVSEFAACSRVLPCCMRINPFRDEDTGQFPRTHTQTHTHTHAHTHTHTLTPAACDSMPCAMRTQAKLFPSVSYCRSYIIMNVCVCVCVCVCVRVCVCVCVCRQSYFKVSPTVVFRTPPSACTAGGVVSDTHHVPRAHTH